MAEMLLGSLVDSLVSTTVDGLKQMAKDEVIWLLGVPDEIEKLSTTFAFMQTVLADAEAKRLKDKRVNIWFEDVKEVVHDMDDILDDWRTEALISKNKVQSCFSPPTCFNHIMFRHNIGNRIKKARKKLSEIAEETSQLGLIALGQAKVAEKTDSQVRQEMINQRETSSLVDNIHSIVGREGDKKAVLEFLLKESSGEVPLVSAIVGMGGLGKTTLAQLVYNDQTIESHFEKRMWVCVSEDFDVKRITKLIKESAGDSFESLGLDTLQNRVKGLLQTRRFLLVLDDIWNEDSGLWEKLQSPLRAGAMGSRILITTRKETVASAARSTHVHKLKVLSDDDCWRLFSHRALLQRNEDERSELEGIGREIVSKCGGLPLAAKTIGSMMWSRRTKREWELVLRSEMWNSQEILPALLLSYYDLPPPLKQCFAYCSVYPKDWRIQKDAVVKLWMAQGFIQCDENEEMEEIGERYFDDLVRRSLIQGDGFRDHKMHDLVHDVAQRVAGSECCSTAVDVGKLSSLGNLRKLRHVWLDDDDASSSVAALSEKPHKLRTLILWTEHPQPPKLSHLRCLRVLMFACDAGHMEVLRTLGQLKHLRYLLVYSNRFPRLNLPEEVCNCVNLQALEVDRFEPPRRIGKLINLRHLRFSSGHYWPRGIGRLTRLRTLANFAVGGSSMEAKGASCGCEELKHLNNLRTLEITELEDVRNVEKAKEAQMHEKQHLRELVLKYSERYEPAGDEEERSVADVAEELQPHPNLEEFELLNYKGCKFPSWLDDPIFRNLQRVMLYNCSRCQWLPRLGSLPSLKEVDILGMKEVTYVVSEFCGGGDDSSSSSNAEVECLKASFPKLEKLTFREMSNWEEWELEIPAKKKKKNGLFFPSLLELNIHHCPKLKAVRFDLLPNLQKLDLSGNQDDLFCEGPLPAHPNLRELQISGIAGRSQLPDGWLGQFKALQNLHIRSCYSLTHLPSELQTLTGLQLLVITECPLLRERCKEGGEEWPKISHIPSIKIR